MRTRWTDLSTEKEMKVMAFKGGRGTARSIKRECLLPQRHSSKEMDKIASGVIRDQVR